MHIVPLKTGTGASVQSQRVTPPPDIVRNQHELSARLADAAPGEIIPYYVGMLAADRSPTSKALTETQRVTLNALAGRMLQLAEAGRVHLVQRRIGRERFAYIAIVRPQPRRRPRLAGTSPALRPSSRRGAGDQAPHATSPVAAGLPREARHAA